MKIVSLNTWGGRAGKKKLLSFFEKYKDEVDVFCLQEIHSKPYNYQDKETAGQDQSNVMFYSYDDISKV